MKNLLDKCSCELRITKQLKKKLAFTDRNFWWCVILVGLVFLFVQFDFCFGSFGFFKLELRISSACTCFFPPSLFSLKNCSGFCLLLRNICLVLWEMKDKQIPILLWPLMFRWIDLLGVLSALLLSTHTVMLMDVDSPGLLFYCLRWKAWGYLPEPVQRRMGLMPSLHPKCQLWKPTLSCSPPADVLKVQRPWSLLADLL